MRMKFIVEVDVEYCDGVSMNADRAAQVVRNGLAQSLEAAEGAGSLGNSHYTAHIVSVDSADGPT